MHILITGAGGFLGAGLVEALAPGHQLRLLDVRPFASPHEVVVADVADLAACRQAMTGIAGLVIAHMAPRGEGDVNYKSPTLPFDINVKGTANLFHAAVEAGVKAVVVISSTAAVDHYLKVEKRTEFPHDLPARALGIYGLTKVVQETIAEQYAREHGLRVACLRVGYILDGERNQDKYGRHVGARVALDTDRRDIGGVARLCLEDASLRFDIFNVMSAPEAQRTWDLQYTCERLHWRPRYDFRWLPTPKETA